MKLHLESSMNDTSTILQSETAMSPNENNDCMSYEPGPQATSRKLQKVNKTSRKLNKKAKMKNKVRNKLFKFNKMSLLMFQENKVSGMVLKKFKWKKYNFKQKKLTSQQPPQPNESYNGFNKKKNSSQWIYDRGKSQISLHTQTKDGLNHGLIIS